MMEKAHASPALDAEAPADLPTLVSFLVNALYLFGGQTVAAPGAPAALAAELARLGHRVAGAPAEGESRTDRSSEAAPAAARKKAARRASPGRLDRIFLAGTLGREPDPVGRLRALRSALRPGGLLCFHVLDRDRAWERTGLRPLEGAGRKARVDFDPASGRLVARVPPEAAEKAAPPASVQTWNLGEAKGLLKAAGLELERAYGDWDGAGPGGSAGRLIVVAARPRGRRKARYSPSSASTSSGSSSATMASTLATRSWGEKGLARKSAKASPTSSTTPSVAP
jgi:SAM-dependent methyltransferase